MIVEPATSPFAAWESFYVIVGSSGAGLIGLQFVVMALISDTNAWPAPTTPSVRHRRLGSPHR